ncbi:MAG: hypothetical protein AAF211_04460 [Myxococcota bacterium]
MSKPPRDLKVTDKGEYVEDGLGPAEDTDVFSKGDDEVAPEPPPSHLDVGSPNEPAAHPDDPLKSLRHQAHEHASDGEKRRKRVPGWMGLAVGLATASVVAFALVVFAGVLLASIGDDGTPDPPARPAQARQPAEPPDEIQGVRVRKGLKRSADEEPLPPKKREP